MKYIQYTGPLESLNPKSRLIPLHQSQGNFKSKSILLVNSTITLNGNIDTKVTSLHPLGYYL